MDVAEVVLHLGHASTVVPNRSRLFFSATIS